MSHVLYHCHFSYINIKHTHPKKGRVCQTRGSTQIPATSSDGSFCRNAAIRYRLLSFTDTAQKAVSSFFVPEGLSRALPLCILVKMSHVLIIADTLSENFLLLYINFPKRKFLRKPERKNWRTQLSCFLIFRSVMLLIHSAVLQTPMSK